MLSGGIKGSCSLSVVYNTLVVNWARGIKFWLFSKNFIKTENTQLSGATQYSKYENLDLNNSYLAIYKPCLELQLWI